MKQATKITLHIFLLTYFCYKCYDICMEDKQETYYSVKQIKDEKTGKLLREVFFDAHGQVGRGDAPSIVDYDLETGNPIEECYFQDGMLHREGAPAKVIRDPKSGMISEEFWYQNGMLHRDDGYPAYVARNLSPEHPLRELGQALKSAHYKNGEKSHETVYDQEHLSKYSIT